MTGSVERHAFPCSPASAGEARRFVESFLVDAGLEHVAYVATMLVSELVANVVLHTETPLEVAVGTAGDRIRVEVHDGSAQLPVRKHYSNLSGTGRGLMLVERMAAEWGAERRPTGKVVWFELDSQPAAIMDIFEVDAL